MVPDIVGMRLGEADEMLAAVGILWCDANPIDNSPFDERSVVVAVSPKPGSVVHPPKFQLTVSAPRRLSRASSPNQGALRRPDEFTRR